LNPQNSDDPNISHDFRTIFTAGWDLKNESGYDVAGGVYLAYWQLNFTSFSSTASLVHKSKFAVIR